MAGLPVGTIVVWYLNDTIPDDWQLCDGTNGTPDLRGSIPMGASVDGDLGVSGGASTHGHTNPSTVNSGGVHSHSSPNVSGNADSSVAVTIGTGRSASDAGHSSSWSISIYDSAAHSDHTLSAPANANHLPLHIKLYYIMKMV